MKPTLALCVLLATASPVLLADLPLAYDPIARFLPAEPHVPHWPDLFARMLAPQPITVRMRMVSLPGEPLIWTGAAYDEEGGLHSVGFMPYSRVLPNGDMEDTILWTYRLPGNGGSSWNWKYDGPALDYGEEYWILYVKAPGETTTAGPRFVTINDE
jgi:hypothetical protein